MERRRRFRVTRHRPLHLVPEGPTGAVRGKFSQAHELYLKARRETANIAPGNRRTAMPLELAYEFLQAQHSTQMDQLRSFLVDTIDLQAEFLIARLESALPKMLAEAAPSDRANVQQQFERLTKTSQGCYALVDYVNFKGEGVLHTERYQGQGWGLLQVLEAMHGTSDAGAVDEFARVAKAVLTRRVQNSPAERHEARWLSGWIRRVNSYNGS